MSRTRHFDASRSSACRVVQPSSSTSGTTSDIGHPRSLENVAQGTGKAPRGAFCPGRGTRPSIRTTVDARREPADMSNGVPNRRLSTGDDEQVTFTADGVTLVGNLAVATDGAPAAVLTGPFTGVKEQVTGGYAARLHECGLTTLAF